MNFWIKYMSQGWLSFSRSLRYRRYWFLVLAFNERIKRLLLTETKVFFTEFLEIQIDVREI